MSEHIYEQRNFNAWNAYVALNGRVNFETFMARHVRVNEWIVSQMKTPTDFSQMDLIQAGD
mgnify:CR=1 FL=1